MHTAVEEVSTATVTVDKADAGKTLSVDLYTIESNNVTGVTEEVKAATATIKLDAVPTVTVKGIRLVRQFLLPAMHLARCSIFCSSK